MTPTDTRAKLETLFKRLSDPATSDIEAMEACLWFRKLRLDAGDVSAALGVPATGASHAPNEADAPATPAASGPVMPWGKYAKTPLADLAKKDAGYMRWLLTKDLKEPLLSQVKAALAGGAS